MEKSTGEDRHKDKGKMNPESNSFDGASLQVPLRAYTHYLSRNGFIFFTLFCNPLSCNTDWMFYYGVDEWEVFNLKRVCDLSGFFHLSLLGHCES